MKWPSARVAKIALIVLALAYCATHVVAGYTESVNWDEFALMQRSERTIVTQQVQGGGRPGLATVLLVPFVDDCTSSIAAVRAARLAWSAITFAMLAGLFAFLLRATRRDWHAAALGTALLALVPVFVKWSLHVRSDQPAIAAGLWAGVALFASARRYRWAFVAGALLATGYLFSQKAIYVAALVGAVVAGDLFVTAQLQWRRELVRAGGVVAGALVVLVGYRLIIPQFYDVQPSITVGGGFSLFEFYRRAVGYRLYAAMLPTLVPHLLALGLLVVVTIRASRARSEHLRSLLVALGVATLGLAVGKFHAAAFPYFWMTLGAFFAVAIAIAWRGIGAIYPRLRSVIAVVAWGWLIVNGVRSSATALEDSQSVQRVMLGFVDRNFDRSFRSYDTHGAMFCRKDPDPIPGAMVSTLIAMFAGPQGATATRDFIDEFRTRPIAIVLLPNRTGAYPSEVTAFLNANYQRYFGAVRLAGRAIQGAAGSRHEVEIIVPGRYRWWSVGDRPSRIAVDGKPAAPTIELSRGDHVVELQDDVSQGMLVLDVVDPPWLGTTQFYSDRADQRWHEERSRRYPPPVFRSR